MAEVSAAEVSAVAVPPPAIDTVRDAEALAATIDRWRAAGLRIALVPTMGALHEGHLSLVRQAAALADRVVASVFVNPTQFNDPGDLERYPRQPERDGALLAGAGCHLMFLPAVETLYPPGATTFVTIDGPPAEGLEGEFRPGHFRGVATVVTLLFNLVRPDLAVFGEKDAQQLAVVRRLTADLHLPVEIVAGATVREPDGLAMSSRNVHLSAGERSRSTALYRALSEARRAIEEGERDADALRRLMHDRLAATPGLVIEYAEVVDGDSFRPLARLDEPSDSGGTGGRRVCLPIAVQLGETRLIDNFLLEIGE